MKNTTFIQKNLVYGEPFKSYSREEWHCIVTDSNEKDEPKKHKEFSIRITAKTKEDVVNTAKVIIKAHSILETVDNVLNEIIKPGE